MHKSGGLSFKAKQYRSLLPHLATFAALLAIWAFVLRAAFSGDRLFSLYEDNEFLLGPLVSGIAHMYSNWTVPLRLDTILGGFPLYNFTQITMFYPFYGFWLDIYNGYLETVRSLHWLTLLHLLLLLVNMNVLLRTIGVDRLSAITGAVMFTFGADMFVYSMWLNVVAPYAWLPLYLAGMLGILKDYASRKDVFLVVFSLLMMVSASPSQPLIHAVLLTSFLSLGYVIHCFVRRTPQQAIKPLLALGAVAVVCFLICAPILLPATLEAGNMIRWIGNFQAIFLNEKIPFDAFVFYRFHLADAWQVLFNKNLHMVGSAYVGFFAIPLVLLAFLRKEGNWMMVVFSTVAIYALLSSFGDEAGMAYINHELPLLNKIREPSRSLALFQFSVAVLASVGLTNLCQVLKNGKVDYARGRRLLAASAVLLITAFVLAWHQFNIVTSEYIRFVVCLVLILSSLCLLKYEFVVARRLLRLVWPIAIVASLVTAVDWRPPLSMGDSHYVMGKYAPLDMAIARVAKMDPTFRYRLIFDGNLNKGYAAMLASYRGVRTFTYYINPAPIHQAVDFSYDYSPYYAYEGAGFLICNQCDISKYTSFKYVKSYGAYDIYFDSRAYPRVYLGIAAGYFSDNLDFISKVKEATPGHDRKVYLEGGNPIGIAQTDVRKDCELHTSFSSGTRQDLLVDCDARHIIVLNEYYDGNWVGYINGIRASIFKVNGNQNGMELSENAQFVSFEYRPPLFVWSFGLSLLGLFLLFWLFCALRPPPP